METLFIYLLKSSGLLLCSFWPTIFYCETFSPVTVGFVGRFDHFRHSAFIGFHEDRLGGTNPQQSTGRKFPLVFPLKTSFEMDWF
jgi:hypothetical protein